MTAIKDLASIDVEHLLGAKYGPLVKIRAEGKDVILLGEVDPDTARKLAAELMTAAARAEYEGDFHRTAVAADMDRQAIGLILHMVRQGEFDRHDNQGETE